MAAAMAAPDPAGRRPPVNGTGSVDGAGEVGEVGATGGIGGPPHGAGRKLVTRTLVRAWDDNIFSESAAAAFWQTLSLPPLLLGLFGVLSYVGDIYGPDTITAVQQRIVQLTSGVFSQQAVEDIIAPTVEQILSTARAEVVSLGFVISLWSGSSAMSSFVDAITRAHEQYLLRNPLWQRLLAVLLYVVGLATGIVALPLIAIAPQRPGQFFPAAWEQTVRPVLDVLVSPAVIGLVLVLALTTLYKVALPLKPPWWRGLPGALLAALVFLVGASGLRLYLNWLTSTGYTYGALAAPIAFLLATFFIGLAIVLGAHFNASIQALWPVPLRDRRHRMARVAAAVGAPAANGSADRVLPEEVPDVLLAPDAALLERAVRQRPDVAAAVLEQMHYGAGDAHVGAATPSGPTGTMVQRRIATVIVSAVIVSAVIVSAVIVSAVIVSVVIVSVVIVR
jgi:membrane protein